jgi:Fe-S-cluster-containing dehydrogenase component
LTPFYAVRCDYCLQRLEIGEPACVSTCAKKAISYRDVDQSETGDIHVVNNHLAVRAPTWSKKER